MSIIFRRDEHRHTHSLLETESYSKRFFGIMSGIGGLELNDESK